jgi:choline dehydrogenase-like flavoprotein
VIPTALATGLCELRTDAMARRLCWTRAGTPPRSLISMPATVCKRSPRLVVVSAGAIETARLLLNSKSRLHPNGLGNRYDWVGPQPAGARLPARGRPVRFRYL